MARFSIETCSGCTRSCATCLRQTYPDRDAVRAWTGKSETMPMPVIHRVLTELWEMGYRDSVGLNQYNEPLMDDRLPEIARFAVNLGFKYVFVITNGDLLTPELAEKLDGAVTHLTISCYDKTAPYDEMRGWFKTTHTSLTGGRHRLSHYSPSPSLEAEIYKLKMQPCFRPARNFIVNHQGDCLMCCEEIVPHFELGNVHEQSLSAIWMGDRRRQIIRDLRKPGGRLKYAYCSVCPCGKDPRRRIDVTNETRECLHAA